MGIILAIGAFNYFGPKHTGSVAAALAIPTVAVVILIILFSSPYLTTTRLEASQHGFRTDWVNFVGIILALSGVEAIANLTGVMKLDPGTTLENPRVKRTARKAILPVAVEVVLGTSLLGWAMVSLPKSLTPQMHQRWEDMMRFLAEYYSGLHFGPQFGAVFGLLVGLVVALLLLSAVNTAVSALIGLGYMMARDGEMPRSMTRLNTHGVPWIPWLLAIVLPILVAGVSYDLESLAGLYAIGVVGAITVNLGTCSLNRHLKLRWHERSIMLITFVVLFAVEFTIAKTKNDALLFAVCVVGAGLGLRAYAQKRAGLRTLTVSHEIAAHVAPELAPEFKPQFNSGKSILVAARGLTPVLRFAMEEARLRQGMLYVVYVKELAVALPGPLNRQEPVRWQNDKQATQIMCSMLSLGKEHAVPVVPLYAVSENPAATILDLAATLGIDMLMLGARHRRTLAQLFKGDVANQVARDLPENIELVIYG
jgi:nucleotide-binding universal stress UspA family protein